MASDTRRPLLADTSSLIAVANTDQWDVLSESLALTTTNVCKHESRITSTRTRTRRKAAANSI